MTVLQTIALPLGYSAVVLQREAIDYVLTTRMSTTGFPEKFPQSALPLAERIFPHILLRAEKA